MVGPENKSIEDLHSMYISSCNEAVRGRVLERDRSVDTLLDNGVFLEADLLNYTEDELKTMRSNKGEIVSMSFIKFLKPFLKAASLWNTDEIMRDLQPHLNQPKWGTSDDIVSALLQDYKDNLVLSRQRVHSSKRQEGTPLPLVNGSMDIDIGQYFKIMGREDTYRVLLHGGLRLFKDFITGSGSPSAYSRQPLFFAFVAFPGAGKSTFGLDFGNLLVEQWLQIPEESKARIIYSYLEGNQVDDYLDMIQHFHDFNLCCYHSLEVDEKGRWLPEENGLHAAQILALRCLHAAIYPPIPSRTTRFMREGYQYFLRALQAKRLNLHEKIEFVDVIRFIRLGLGIPEGKRFPLCWFFDETNAVQGSFPSKDDNDAMHSDNDPTWFQAVLSQYVSALDLLHKNGSLTFPLMTIGTTRFSAGNMKLTKTGRAKAIAVPLRPLSFDEVSNIVQGLMKRLALTAGVEILDDSLPESLSLMLRFCGGMPRMLALLMHALLDERNSKSPSSLLESLRRNRDYDQVSVVLRRLLGRIGKNDYFLGYPGNAEKVGILLRALAASVLGIVVTRKSRVIEGSKFSDTWGDLEAEGLIALKVNYREAGGKKPNIEEKHVDVAVDVGNVKVQVQFCPILLFHLSDREFVFSESKTWLFAMPNVHCQWWKKIEQAHISVIMLKLELLRLSYCRREFKVRDLFAPYVVVPQFLQPWSFSMPREDHMTVCPTNQLKTPKEFFSHANQTLSDVFIGPGNSGLDSWFSAIEVSQGKRLFFCLQSRSRMSEQYVSIRTVLDSFEHDCGKWFTLPRLSRSQMRKREEILGSRYEAGVECADSKTQLRCHDHRVSYAEVEDDGGENMMTELPDFIYLYCTDEKVSEQALNQLDDLVMNDDPWAIQIVLWYNEKDPTTSDPLSLFSLLRYVNEHPPKAGL